MQKDCLTTLVKTGDDVNTVSVGPNCGAMSVKKDEIAFSETSFKGVATYNVTSDSASKIANLNLAWKTNMAKISTGAWLWRAKMSSDLEDYYAVNTNVMGLLE